MQEDDFQRMVLAISKSFCTLLCHCCEIPGTLRFMFLEHGLFLGLGNTQSIFELEIPSLILEILNKE